MAEFQTVVKNLQRMCESYDTCDGCPLFGVGYAKSRIQCRFRVFEECEEAERIIIQWAAKHPIKTNGIKFREVFGQPYEYLFEADGFIKQWLSQEYKGGQDEQN